MNILMACAELAPFVRVGEIADVVAALARTLSGLDHHVTVVLPRYQAVDFSRLMLARRLSPLRLAVGNETLEVTQFDGRLPGGVELSLVDIPGVFDDAAVSADGLADARRFGLYCRAVAALVEKRASDGAGYDVVHAHGWPAALLPFLLKDSAVRTVLTVHDVGQQGRYDKGAVDAIGLSWDDFHPAGLEFYGQLNFLKAGVLGADVVTVASSSYCERIQQADGGHGLDGVFRARASGVAVVAHGVDPARFSPSTDPNLVAHYDAEEPTGKARCKTTLLYELDLPLEPERPLLVAFGPLTHERGADVLAEALGDLARADARVVLAGGGEPQLVERLATLADNLPGDVLVLEQLSEPLRHRLFAAADAVLLPVRSEPSGLVHRIAQRYGAIVIGHAVDALADDIVDADAHCQTGTGYLFDELSPSALVGAVTRAITAMRTAGWAALRRRAMRLDLGWDRPARRYVSLYRAS